MPGCSAREERIALLSDQFLVEDPVIDFEADEVNTGREAGKVEAQD